MRRYGSDELGMIPSWAIAETMRRSEERRRRCATDRLIAEERHQTATLRWRKRWERIGGAFGFLREPRPSDAAEA